MHEASLVQGLLKIVLEGLADYECAIPDKARLKVDEIVCEAGLLSCCEARTLEACFEIFAENTPAEGAKLIVSSAPLNCLCDACGAKFTLRERHFVCPSCGEDKISFSGGNGLTLMAINVKES